MDKGSLHALSNHQINAKLAKLYGWKLVGKKWWHDDIGDGPPSNYVGALGRGSVEQIISALLAKKKSRPPK